MDTLIKNMIETLNAELIVINREIKDIKREIKELKSIDVNNKYIEHEQLEVDKQHLQKRLEYKTLELKKCKGAIRRLNKVLEMC